MLTLLAPGIFGGTQVFLEYPDHAGTAVPIFVLLLLLILVVNAPGTSPPASGAGAAGGRAARVTGPGGAAGDRTQDRRIMSPLL